ncbi:MAG: hypothetical protein Q7S27_00190 [Nanoarchaeota archaeon]|nr:hypothetical protein [Nanoarchaeota archaeon]
MAEKGLTERRYVLEASHPNVDSREVAEEIKLIAFSLPSEDNFGKGTFNGEIYYEETGKYVPFREFKSF